MISVKLQTNFIEITLPRGCSPVNLQHICRTAVLANTYGELLMQIFIQHACHVFQYKFVSNLGCFLIYFWLVQCSIQNEQSFVFQTFLCSILESFVKFCWIVFLQGGVWLNRCRNAGCSNCYVAFFQKTFLQQKLVFLLIFEAL